MNSGRNTVVSVLGFGIVLFIAILCRPYTSQFSHPIVYMETEDYDDGELDPSILDVREI